MMIGEQVRYSLIIRPIGNVDILFYLSVCLQM